MINKVDDTNKEIIRELIDFKPVQRGTNISEGLRYFTNVIKKKSTVLEVVLVEIGRFLFFRC